MNKEDARQVVDVPKPKAVTERGAGIYTSTSCSHLRNMRARDAKKVQEGLEIEGPAWVKLGNAVRYLTDDLDAWLLKNRVAGTRTPQEGHENA